MYYTNDGTKLYVGMMAVGDREATQAEIDAHNLLLLPMQKHNNYLLEEQNLTIATTIGNVYNASFASIGAMKARLDAMPTSLSTIKWYEDWATYTITKTELQEAYDKASSANQALLDLKMA